MPSSDCTVLDRLDILRACCTTDVGSRGKSSVGEYSEDFFIGQVEGSARFSKRGLGCVLDTRV